MAAISLPTRDAKEESIPYARVLIEQGCSLNCCHFECKCNATSRQALSRKRRDSHEHIPECPIDGKKQSIDWYQSIMRVSFNRLSIDNHKKAFNQEPTPCVRMETGMVRVKCRAQAHNTSTPGKGSNAGVECSNHEATTELKAKKGRRPLKASLSSADQRRWNSVARADQVSVVLAGCQPTCLSVHVDWHSTESRPICRLRLSRYIGRVSVAILANSIDRHSVDRCLSTHDPHFPAAEEKQNSFCQYIVTNRVTLWSASYSAWYRPF